MESTSVKCSPVIPIISPAIEEYCRAHSLTTSPLRDELFVYTHAHCQMPQMLTGPLEGAFLAMLVRLTQARRIVEIGLFTGYSALSMAEALPTSGRIVSCEISEQNAAIARRFFDRSPHGGKIEIRMGPALKTLESLAGPFDLAFVDADKENYIAYFEALVPKLAPGGLIVADNVLWSGKVLDPKEASDRAIAAFNDHVARDPRVEVVMLPVRDGVSLIRRV
jgi:caffeoyl-CoA O-methyltransferase